MAATVFNALDAVRRAGLNSGDLNPDHFEVADKGLELAEILSAYLQALRERGWIDRADALRLAIDRIRTDSKALPESVLVIVPEDIDLSGLEGQLLAMIPDRELVRLQVDQPGALSQDERESLRGLSLLRLIHSPAEAPDPVNDRSAQIFRAVGEVNEVRGVLRRCLARGIPLDHVELLCTDKATYIPLIYETFPRLNVDDAGDDDIPVTFQEGLPARRFRPGRALVAWLAWMRDDYPQHALVQMIREGLLQLPEHGGDSPSFSRLASAFASMKIGFGRDRYLETLDEHASASRRRSADPKSLRDEDGLLDTRRRSPEERLKEFQILRELIDTLLKLSARAEEPGIAALECAREFLEKHARLAGRLDTYASHGLIKRIKELERAVDPGDDGSSIDFRAWLAALADDVWVGGEGPRPGRLHVADVLAGGHSGRPHTFVIGLDDGRFPGSGIQDPMLLDDERKRLSPDLRTASSQLARKLDQVARLFARLRGRVTLSYSCYSLADDRETFPSSTVLSAFRILSGQRDGDHAALVRWLGPAESFAPEGADQALNEAEWWLWRATGSEEVLDSQAVVSARYPHLGRGYTLARERSSDRFTVFDGWLESPGRELDMTAPEGPAVSASRLETLGACPLRYFFRYVLDLEPPDELLIDANVWLDPLARGSLLHEVFERFLSELVERGAVPDARRDEAQLLEVLQNLIDRYRAEIPPPSEAVFRREVSQLGRTARIFLREEAEYCRETGNRPLFMEVSIGMKSAGTPSALDAGEPVEIKLPDGQTLRVRGRIDRIDQVVGRGANRFAIWDYKTGGTWKYTQEPRPFWAGRVVQHALYTLVLSARLKAVSGEFPGGMVDRFGYFFPSEKAGGERIEFTPEELEDGGRVLAKLAAIASGGAFLATNQHDKDCGFCDYTGICGDVAGVAGASDRKLRAASNTILKPYLELRTNG